MIIDIDIETCSPKDFPMKPSAPSTMFSMRQPCSGKANTTTSLNDFRSNERLTSMIPYIPGAAKYRLKS